MTNKIFFTILAIVIIVISIFSFSHSVVKPFTLDEVEEARMAQKINIIGPKTFHPVDQGGGGEPLSHPLLYSYTNAIFFKFFGNSEVALRSYGIVFYVLSLMVVCFFIADIFKDDKEKMLKGLWIASTLYLLNPLLIQHSMLLNADNNISAFFILIYVYLFYKFENEPSENFLITRLILAFVVALNFMAKEITPMFLVLSIGVYRLFNREFKKLLLDIIFNIILGMAFSGSFGGYIVCQRIQILWDLLSLHLLAKERKFLDYLFY